jgi:hypothetical protein
MKKMRDCKQQNKPITSIDRSLQRWLLLVVIVISIHYLHIIHYITSLLICYTIYLYDLLTVKISHQNKAFVYLSLLPFFFYKHYKYNNAFTTQITITLQRDNGKKMANTHIKPVNHYATSHSFILTLC